MAYHFLRPIVQEELVVRIKTADICISDLDYTDANSPAKNLAADFFHFWSKDYARWALSTAKRKISPLERQRADSESWSEFIDSFLKKEEELEYVKQRFSEAQVKKSLYPGVEEFYQSISGALKVYLTRNIPEVADAYARELGINVIIAEAFDKTEAIENYFLNNWNLKRWVVKGDSEEDAEVLDFLEYQKRRRKIDDVVGIYVCGDSYNSKFDINIPQDYRGLVEAMKRFG